MSAAPQTAVPAKAAPVEAVAAEMPTEPQPTAEVPPGAPSTDQKADADAETPAPKRTSLNINLHKIIDPFVSRKSKDEPKKEVPGSSKPATTVPAPTTAKDAEPAEPAETSKPFKRRLSIKTPNIPAGLLKRTKKAFEDATFNFEHSKTEETPKKKAEKEAAKAEKEAAQAKEVTPAEPKDKPEQGSAEPEVENKENSAEEATPKEKNRRRLALKSPKLPSGFLDRSKKAFGDAAFKFENRQTEETPKEKHEKADATDGKIKAKNEPAEETKADAKPTKDAELKTSGTRRLSIRAGHLGSNFYVNTKKAFGQATSRLGHEKKSASSDLDPKEAEPAAEKVAPAEEAKAKASPAATEKPAEAQAA